MLHLHFQLPQLFRLELLQQRLKDASPERLLARGYSITLKDGKVVKDFKQVQEGDEVVTRIYQGELLSVIKASKKIRNTV